MTDPRVAFIDVKSEFRKFLQSQDWPTEILWLTRNRIIGYRRTHWIFRPDELATENASREFYDAVAKTESSIRIDAFAKMNRQTLAYVHNWGGNSRMLNLGVPTSEWPIRQVSSRIVWVCLRFGTVLLGSSPFLKSTNMTNTAQPAAAAGR
jgi:hypothetical protein